MRQGEHSRVLAGIKLAVTFLVTGAALSLRAADTRGAGSSELGPPDDGDILLVRSWNQQSGELIGWMPLHRVAITLQQVTPRELSLDLNDAVTIKLPAPSVKIPKADSVRIAPEATTFQGKKWLPVDREPNLVQVKKCLFYVKSIMFVQSKWRFASKPQ